MQKERAPPKFEIMKHHAIIYTTHPGTFSIHQCKQNSLYQAVLLLYCPLNDLILKSFSGFGSGVIEGLRMESDTLSDVA